MMWRDIKMINVIDEKIIKKIINTAPRYLPHNLKLLKNNLGMSCGEIAREIDLRPSYFNIVLNGKGTFSGKTIIKLIHKFNVSFDLIYNVNREVTILEDEKVTYYLLIEVDTISDENANNIIELLNSNIKEDDVLTINILKQVDLDNEVNYLRLTDENIEKIGKNKVESYTSYINSFNLDKSKKYVFAEYSVSKCEEVVKHINLYENFDYNLNSYLDTVDYDLVTKYAKLEFNKLDLIEGDDKYLLPEKLCVQNQKGEYEDSTFVYKKFCIENDNTIVISVKIQRKNTNKLRQMREFKNMSVEEMADKLQITPETYNLIEKGNQKFSTQIMWKLEYTCGVLLEKVINISEYYNEFCKDNNS